MYTERNDKDIIKDIPVATIIKLNTFMDNNPHVLDMPDRKIPTYLQENIPELSTQEAVKTLYLVAQRRLENMSV